MSFPLEFRKSKGDYDFASPFINLMGNGAVLVIGAGGAATISHVALKALGYDKAAESTIIAVPIMMGELGLAGTFIGGAMIIAMVASVSNGLGR